MGSSDSVFSTDSEYGFEKSQNALESFIWPKHGCWLTMLEQFTPYLCGINHWHQRQDVFIVVTCLGIIWILDLTSVRMMDLFIFGLMNRRWTRNRMRCKYEILTLKLSEKCAWTFKVLKSASKSEPFLKTNVIGQSVTAEPREGDKSTILFVYNQHAVLAFS